MKKQCPHCYEIIEAFVMHRWDNSENPTRDFEINCPKCLKEIIVEVRVEPTFNYRKVS